VNFVANYIVANWFVNFVANYIDSPDVRPSMQVTTEIAMQALRASGTPASVPYMGRVLPPLPGPFSLHLDTGNWRRITVMRSHRITACRMPQWHTA